MFYHPQLLHHQHKLQLNRAWLAATIGLKQMKKDVIITCDVFKLCDYIMQFLRSDSKDPNKRFSLRLSTMLVHGTVLIWSRQVIFLKDDISYFIQERERKLASLTAVLESDDPKTKPVLKKKKRTKPNIVVETPESLELTRIERAAEPELDPLTPIVLPDILQEEEVQPARLDEITLREDEPRPQEPRWIDDFGELGTIPQPAQVSSIEEPLQPNQMIVVADVHVSAVAAEVPTPALPELSSEQIKIPEQPHLQEEAVQQIQDEVPPVIVQPASPKEKEEIEKAAEKGEEEKQKKQEKPKDVKAPTTAVVKGIKKKTQDIATALRINRNIHKVVHINQKLEIFDDQEDYTELIRDMTRRLPNFKPMEKFWPDSKKGTEDAELAEGVRGSKRTDTLGTSVTIGDLPAGTPSLSSVAQSTPKEVASAGPKLVSTPTKRPLPFDRTVIETIPPPANGAMGPPMSPAKRRKLFSVEKTPVVDQPAEKLPEEPIPEALVQMEVDLGEVPSMVVTVPEEEIQVMPEKEKDTSMAEMVAVPREEIQVMPEKEADTSMAEMAAVPREEIQVMPEKETDTRANIMRVVDEHTKITPVNLCKELNQRLTKLNMAVIFSSVLGLEQKYMETKSKLKKSLQYNERYTIQIQKLNKRVKQLENENKQLEHQVNQLQTTGRDTSESDLSSPANLHQEHVNMVDLVHSKNQQISDLLKDIEEVENDNVVLRDKLSETKDQLSTATTEMAAMTVTLNAEELRVQEQDEIIKTLKLEIEQIKVQFETTRNEKEVLEQKFNKLVNEGREKEAEWKILLDQKEKEIEILKDSLPKDSEKKSPATSMKDQDSINESNTPEVDELKIALSEAENQLCVLKSEMENCTIELKQSTKIINKLKAERELLEKKVEERKHNENEIKEQLKKAHDRCQGMQREVEYANKLTKLFETDLSTVKDQMKDDGQVEIVNNLEQIQNLKIEKLLHEKQIVGLVKDINKLQEMCNIFEIENVFLRQQMGLSPQDTVDIDANIYSESKKQKKLIEKLQTDNMNTQEDKVKLKLENKRLKKQIAALMSESATNEDKSESILENGFSSSQIKDDRLADIKALSEENEALRKGLHEILNSVQVKNETSPRELKSDVLEGLLRALDVKHISGWYHPAMRLQAELHTLEGVNTELREQLHEARTELDKFKSTPTPRRDQVDNIEQIVIKTGDESREIKSSIFENLLSNDVSCLEKIKISVLKIVIYLNESDADVESKLENEFEYLKQHVDLLHSNCNNEKSQLLENIKNTEKNIFDLESETTDTDISPGELTKLVHIEKKKAQYSFRQINKLQEELVTIKLNNKKLQSGYLCEIEQLLNKIAVLQSKLNFKEKQSLHFINTEVFKEVQNALNESLKKYRQLLANVEDQKNQSAVEIEILTQKELDLIKENNELKEKLNKVLNKLNQETHKQEQNVLPLSQKLADAEVHEISEKHRADHTNNLYELVKEQLKKSEEKFVEFSKYGDGLLQKNLVLQERVAGLEDQLTLWVDPELFKESLENLNSLVKEKEQLIDENNELSKKYNELIDSMRETSTWNKEKEQELLGLKHEIIDLTATSDEKSIIDQLYCDLSKSRSELREQQLQVDFLRREISNWESRYTKLYTEIEIQRSHFEVGRKVMDKKIGTLQDIVLKQRILYHGCIPLTIQEILVDKLQNINKEKHEAFISFQNAKTLEGKLQSSQQYNTKKAMVDNDYDCRSQQIKYLQQKIQTQERDLEKLEKELFSAYMIMEFNKPAKDVSAIRKRPPMLIRELVSQESIDPVAVSNEPREEKRPSARKESKVVILRNVESQTESQTEKKEDKELTMVKIQLNSLQNQVSTKDNCIADKDRLLLEKTQELAVTQEKLKQNQNRITALENSLRTIQDREKIQSRAEHDGAAGDGAGLRNNFLDEQIMSLRVNLKTAQDRIKQKDVEIIKYQTLLKEDRDKHSLAAANLQQELVILKQALVAEEQNNKSLQQESAISRQKSAAVEKYVSQVRALEKHLAELHTQIAQLKVQLQNAHQEATRWRQMAQDRLVAMQKLGESLNEQHNKELSSYKTDYEKLKELSEEEPSKRGGLERKIVGYIDPDIVKLCTEKDEKISQLIAKLKQMESGETIEKPTSSDITSGKEKSNNAREHEILRKKYEDMVNKERILKEEIRDLKEQVSKRSNLSARSQKSERTVKEQLQRRISYLEREIESLNDKLLQQQLINEKHKLSANEDFEKWKKQKYWQENCQKYKRESEERKEEIQKLQQTCTGYRMLIERLEREKINLENRIKALKSEQRSSVSDQEKVLLKEENDRLACQLATLQAKMELRQQGAGALGAALMQDKLEAQERKIAILELSSKGTVEVRNELERLHTSMANLQKNNLCLEAENLELKMDLEKHSKETPHLQEQIQHLESYIQLLKDENQKQVSSANDVPRVAESADDKKVSQLERTVFILKRVVEKLQVENKRLVSGKRPLSERSPSAEKLRRDYLRLKEQYTESLQRIKDLESQLQVSKRTQRNQLGNDTTDEVHSQLTEVKEQLLQKTQLLDKVKSLLHTAAAREKQLLKEVAELRCGVVEEKDYHIDIPSPIEEVSEVSSDH